MHTVIRKTAGRDLAEMESVLARLLDAMLIALSAALADLLFMPGSGHSILEGAFVALDIAFAVLLLPWFGVYDSWRGRSKWRLSINLVFGWIAVQVCGLAVLFLLHRASQVSRLWCGSWTVIAAAALVASRWVVHAVLGRMRRSGRNLRMVAVVGAGAHRDAVIANIMGSPDAGFRAVATFNTRQDSGSWFSGLPSFEGFREFADWVRREQVEEVWLALPMSEEDTVLRVLDEFSGDLVNLRFIPDVRNC
jgi:FlaA1/EpsC-like NDP-sugar epimerase